MYYTCMYNAGAGYKEVTLKTHGNNGLAILHGNMKYTLSVLMRIAPKIFIMEVITTYIHYSAGAVEVAIMHGNKSSP